MCNHVTSVYHQADKRFWDNHEKSQKVKVRYDKLPTVGSSGLSRGKLSEKATLTLEQFVAELKKRIQAREKQKNDKSSAAKVANELGKGRQPIQKLPPANSNKPRTRKKNAKANPSPPNSIVKTPLPVKKKEVNQESRVPIPAPDKSKDTKIAGPSPKLKPSQHPSISKKKTQTKIPKIKQFPNIPIAGIPSPVSPKLSRPPSSLPPFKTKPKQPKFHFPKLKGTAKKKNPILDQEEDDFFKSGNADAHNEHHVHQHDHLHAHKAFHKHKQTHEHSHAHSNDHVHNHKHTHNHVHNHIHKHNEDHEHTATHSHTEKHHHKHLEYIDAGKSISFLQILIYLWFRWMEEKK